MNVRLSPSLMCADMLELSPTLAAFEAEGVELLHVDVMDGHFVSNFTLGTDFLRAIRRASAIPLDVHLMVERPEACLEWFQPQPGEVFALHAESTPHLQRALAKARELGASPVVALNPATPLAVVEEVLSDVDGVLVMTVNPGFAGQKLVPQTLDKIARLRRLLDANGRENVFIEVDGNVSVENAVKMRRAGADTFVLGTSCLFGAGDLRQALRAFRRAVM